jgi:hypothetical protein
LIKIDVEGYEPVLVACLGALIQKYQPDLLIEVLDETAAKLEQTSALRGYHKFLITSGGLREAQCLFACPNYRDWVLLFERTSSEKCPISTASSAVSPI